MNPTETTPSEAEGQEARAAASPPVALWVYGSRVSFTVIDEPSAHFETACRCGGCRAAKQADLAARFL